MPQDETTLGQEPAEPQAPQAGDSGNDNEIAKLRAEAAKWRTQLRDAQKQVKEYQPLAAKYSELEIANQSEAEKMAARLTELEGQLSQAQANATRADNERKLTALAAKAGVSADMLNYLDVSKFDLDDEEATTLALSALVPVTQANSGTSSNPARTNAGADGMTAEEWYKDRTGQRATDIFGRK